jgi:hypothetical protein
VARHYHRRTRRRKFAQGKKSYAICDRSGFKHRLKDMVLEPGTGLLVYKGWSDGMWNLVDHPQNFPADVGEAVGLQNPRPDVPESEAPLLRNDQGEILVGEDGLPYFVIE